MRLTRPQERVLLAVADGASYTGGRILWPDGRVRYTSAVVGHNLNRLGLLAGRRITQKGRDEANRRRTSQ